MTRTCLAVAAGWHGQAGTRAGHRPAEQAAGRADVTLTPPATGAGSDHAELSRTGKRAPASAAGRACATPAAHAGILPPSAALPAAGLTRWPPFAQVLGTCSRLAGWQAAAGCRQSRDRPGCGPARPGRPGIFMAAGGPGRRILVTMSSHRAASRRHLATSPFSVPDPEPPAERSRSMTRSPTTSTASARSPMSKTDPPC